MHYNYLLSNDEDGVGVEALTDSYNDAIESLTDGSMLDVNDELETVDGDLVVTKSLFKISND